MSSIVGAILRNPPSMLVVGQAAVDHVLPEDPLAHESLRVGGKALNQAVAASRLQAEVELGTAIGNDKFAEDIRAVLSQEGVGQQYVVTAGGGHGQRYSSVVVELTEGRKGKRHVAVINETPLHRWFAAAIEHIGRMPPPDILQTTFELPERSLEQIIQIIERMRSTTPHMLAVVNPAPQRIVSERLRVGLKSFDLLVPNQAEAEALLEHDLDDPVDAATELRAVYGSAHVCITLGSGGVAWADGERQGLQAAFPALLVDKIGASDTFVSALSLAFYYTKELQSSVQFATACAGLSVASPGGYEACPTLEDVHTALWSTSPGEWEGARFAIETMRKRIA
jgi:ribokinase